MSFVYIFCDSGNITRILNNADKNEKYRINYVIFISIRSFVCVLLQKEKEMKYQKLTILCVIINIVCCAPVETSKSDVVLYDKSVTLYEQGRYSEASNSFQTLISEYEWSSKRSKSWYYLGKSQLNHALDTLDSTATVNLCFEAISSFDSVPYISDKYVDAQFCIGETLLELAQHMDDDSTIALNAEYAFRQLREKWPHNEKSQKAQVYIGNCYRVRGDTTAALALYTEIIKSPELSRVYDKALWELGFTYFELEKFDSSAVSLYQLYQELPLSSKADNAVLYLGHQHRDRSVVAIEDKEYLEGQVQIDSAMIWYQKVVAEYPEGSALDNALFEIGDYYYTRRFQGDKADSAIYYLSSYCDIADTSRSKYSEAREKLMGLGVLYEK